MKFKHGDNVRVVKPEGAKLSTGRSGWNVEMDQYVGTEFALDTLGKDSIKGPGGWFYDLDWLELVEKDKPQPVGFKIGDKVRVVRPEAEENVGNYFWHPDMDENVGFVFTVDCIRPLDGGIPKGDWIYAPEWLELVEEYSAANTGRFLGTEENKANTPKGLKFDDQKPPVGLVFESFPRALLEVAKVAGHGAEKYGRGNCFHVENAVVRYSDAEGRHLLNQYIEGDRDLDSGELHLAHKAWNALLLLELKLRGE